MAKEALKAPFIPEGADPSLYDTDRIIPKAEGGDYSPENYRVLSPVEHMKRHGILRIRPDDLENLKAAIDIREQNLKGKNKVNNQLLAYERRTDTPGSNGDLAPLHDYLGFIEKEETKAEREVIKQIKAIGKYDPLVEAALSILGIGEQTVAYLTAYVDLEKASHASSVWAYVGYDKPSHERYTKGEKGGGNKRLRTALWRMADSMVRTRGAYRVDYDRRKDRTSASQKMVKTRNRQGHLVEMLWMDTMKSHRHGDAMRVMTKLFLCHYWLVGRQIRGLPISDPYVQEHLGHTHIVRPEERGWPVITNEYE